MKIGKRESGKRKQTHARCSTFPLSRFPDFRFASYGFTLIELMTVIVIVAIMTAMIIPEMKGSFEDALLRSTSRDLVSVFELASSRAISLNQMHRVRLDTTTGRYVVERRVREGGLQSFIPLEDVSGCKGELDQRIAVEIRRADAPPPGADDEAEAAQLVDTIAFSPDGTCDPSVILLQDRAGFRLALKLNPITSRVQVLELDKQ
jgi:type II secretion system protein H